MNIDTLKPRNPRWLALSALVILMGGQLSALDRPAALEAIRHKEGVTYPHRPSKHLELGYWQMVPATVKSAGGYDYAAALRHLNWLEIQFRRNNIDFNIFNIGLAWNGGLGNILSGTIPTISYHYAKDVDSIYHSIHK